MEEQAPSHLLPYARRKDFKVGRATELAGSDRRFFRFLEILPGALSWTILIGIILASMYAPFFAAYFIIAFSIYWVLKTIFLSYHVRYNWKRLMHHMQLDWSQLVARFEYQHLYHLVVLPFYHEPEEVVTGSLEGLLSAKYDPKRMIVVLAAEERAGEDERTLAYEMEQRYKDKFGHFLVTIHPADTPGELAGKGSNTHYALHQVHQQVIEPARIPHKDILVSIFDIDTVVYPDYFNCLVWHFMTTEK